MAESNPELESFRQQWRAEVSARSKPDSLNAAITSNSGPSNPARKLPPIPRVGSDKSLRTSQGGEDHAEPRSIHGLDEHRGAGTEYTEEPDSETGSREPRSALEHYEKAVEKEAQGRLGDSLDLYRRAFRLDDRVDQKYKNKHFPPSSFPSKPKNPNPSNASATVPNPAHHSLDGHPPTIKQIIAGFSGLSIEPIPPAIDGTPALPCPLADLPEEILVHVLKEVAILDVATFVRLALVCKRLAYLVATEDQIWKRVCQGSEVGFGAMHYQWQRDVLGGPLEEDVPEQPQEGVDDVNDWKDTSKDVGTFSEALLHSTYSSSWQQMFRFRPRIRFNGCYISTVTYTRQGQASPSQVTWSSPIHIVTYYRYLRFFRDGTVISLLTTSEPADVVHHLTKELEETHRHGASAHLPTAVMQTALRGRWRLSSPSDKPGANPKDAEGDVYIETEGVGPKYLYRMELCLHSTGRSSGGGVTNNKLTWKGFWSYNRLTDDLGEFTLRNDKSFFWSRVRSYGVGA